MKPIYDRYTIMLHWAIALLIFAEYVFVWLIPEGTHGPNALASYHESFGIVVLALMLVRILWRARQNAARPHRSPQSWEETAAIWMHGSLYLLLILLPLTGWLWISANGWHVTLFGVVPLPHILPTNAALGTFFRGAHELLASMVLALVALHTAAALFHWLVLKDRVMQQMWP